MVTVRSDKKEGEGMSGLISVVHAPVFYFTNVSRDYQTDFFAKLWSEIFLASGPIGAPQIWGYVGL